MKYEEIGLPEKRGNTFEGADGCDPLLEAYITEMITPEDDYLHRLYRATQTKLLRPRMASGHWQGTLLRLLTKLLRPKRVLEIGTYTGYSALSIAAGMEADGLIRTYEINDEQEDFTRPWLESAPYPPRIELIIGDVLDLLPKENEVYDMAFIDGNKRDYCTYYDLVLPRLRSGGLLLADNTLWDGHVIDPAYDNDPQTKGIREFNRRVAHDERVETVILPLRDGLTLIRKM